MQESLQAPGTRMQMEITDDFTSIFEAKSIQFWLMNLNQVLPPQPSHLLDMDSKEKKKEQNRSKEISYN